MKKQWAMYAARFDVMARRERAMLAAVGLFGPAVLGYSFVLQPNLTRYETHTKTLAKASADVKTIEAQLSVIQAQIKDPDAPNRSALLATRKDLGALDSKLRAMENSLVPPNKMQGFLESFLAKNRTLELLAFSTLPPTPLIERTDEKKTASKTDGSAASGSGKSDAPPAAGNGKGDTPPGGAGGKVEVAPPAPTIATPNIYKHGIEIKVAGNYQDLLAYLTEIERMPQRIIWNRVKLSTELYPRNEMTLTVYTLSLDKQWLVV